MELTYREACRQAIWEEMERDPNVIIFGEDVALIGGTFGVSAGMLEKFGPDRVLDTPISEAAIIGAAAGSAMTGLRPIGELMFIDFVTVGMDQLVNQAAKWHYMTGGQVSVPMVIRAATGTGRRMAAQHSQNLEAWFTHVPGLKVIMPSCPNDAKGLLKSAIRDNNPVLFLEHKIMYNDEGEVQEGEFVLPIGKADIKREGTDVTVVAISRMVGYTLKAAEILEKEGISVEVVDPRTLKPLDIDTIIESVRKTNKVAIVHEATEFGGFGAEIAAKIGTNAFADLDAPVLRICGSENPIPFSPTLEDASIPSVESITEGIRQLVKGGN
jgi:pyruvate/2-oxoglutarate/acetoin dehydrogenase E1 component